MTDETDHNVPTTQAGGGPVAKAEDFNHYAAYGEMATSGTRNLTKFRKGQFSFGQDETAIPIGTRLIANMPEAQAGYIRWRDGRPTDEVMVRIGDGVAPPRRNELGDDDRSLWELDERGDPKDPWQFTNYLPLIGPETGDEFLFATSSRGGINAVGALCTAYGAEYRQMPGQFPVIELQASGYAHSNKNFGRIDVPTFPVVDWVKMSDPPGGASGHQIPENSASESESTTGADDGANRTGTGRRTRF